MKSLLTIPVGLILCHAASAAVLYNTFGPGDTCKVGNGYTLIGSEAASAWRANGWPEMGLQALSAPFTVAGDAGAKYAVTSLVFAAENSPFRYNADFFDHGTVEYVDSLGSLSLNANGINGPGSAIYSTAAKVDNKLANFGAVGVFSVSVSTPVILEAGQTYWLTLMPDAEIFNYLVFTDQEFTGIGYSFDEGSKWWYNTTAPTVAFRVTGDLVPVPEPATYFAGCATLGLMGLIGWRKRK